MWLSRAKTTSLVGREKRRQEQYITSCSSPENPAQQQDGAHLEVLPTLVEESHILHQEDVFQSAGTGSLADKLVCKNKSRYAFTLFRRLKRGLRDCNCIMVPMLQHLEDKKRDGCWDLEEKRVGHLLSDPKAERWYAKCVLTLSHSSTRVENEKPKWGPWTPKQFWFSYLECRPVCSVVSTH